MCQLNYKIFCVHIIAQWLHKKKAHNVFKMDRDRPLESDLKQTNKQKQGCIYSFPVFPDTHTLLSSSSPPTLSGGCKCVHIPNTSQLNQSIHLQDAVAVAS